MSMFKARTSLSRTRLAIVILGTLLGCSKGGGGMMTTLPADADSGGNGGGGGSEDSGSAPDILPSNDGGSLDRNATSTDLGAVSPDGAPDATAGSDAAANPFGSIGQINFVLGNRNGGSVLVNFLQSAFWGGPSTCPANRKIGDCCFDSLVGPDSTDTSTTGPADAGMSTPTPPRPTRPQPPPQCAMRDGNAEAGLLTFSKNSQPWGTANRSPAIGYRFVPNAGESVTWKGGDVLGVSVPGGPCIPAFAGMIVATAVIDSQIPSTLDLSGDITFEWLPDPNATSMMVALSGETQGGSYGSVKCEVPDRVGKLVLPAAATKLFVPDPTASLTLQRSRTIEPGPDMRLNVTTDRREFVRLR
jgi:hypothetical protein